MGMDKAMRVAGIGCRKGVSAADVLAAIDAALAAAGLRRAALDALATIPTKRHEHALGDASSALGLTLLVPSDGDIAAAAPHALTRSAASQAATGTSSASEVAALAAAGPNSRLLGPRLICGHVTCAIAVSEDMP
jgi:cobalt-precorrin 5A hydrolase